MTAAPEPLARLAEYIERRITELALEYAEVCRRAGISDETLMKIRKGVRARGSTYRKLEQALRWEQGGIAVILGGGEPAPMESQKAEQPPQGSTPPHEPGLSRGEAFRRVVRSSAREFGLTPDDFDEAVRLVREDLEEAPLPVGTVVGSSRGIPYRVTGRTDLSDLVREARREAGASLEEVSARAVDPKSGAHVVDADWLDRLERAALVPDEYPEYPQLDALVVALALDVAEVRGAAGAQFLGLETNWSDDGQARGVLLQEHVTPENLDKVRALMRRFAPAPQRRD